jgi:hypothetical protein
MSDLKPDSIAAVPPVQGSTNRGNDVAVTSNDAPQITVTLETINGILMNYMRDTIQPMITENDMQKVVPIEYGSGERWQTIRQDGFLREPSTGKLLAPLIVVRRTAVKQGQLINPNNKYVYTTLATGWNVNNVYDQFAVLNRIRPAQQLRTVIVPDYMDLSYEIVMWTEYQSQMDTLIEQINVENYEFWGPRNNFKFRVSIDSFDSQNNLPATSERLVRTEFQMKVSAYLIPERYVKNFKLASTNQKAFSPKKIVIREEVVSDITKIK